MKFTPQHLHVILLHWEGMENKDIAQRFSKSEAWVSSLISSPEGQEALKRISNRALDTTQQIQSIIQAIAPSLLQRKIALAMYSSNDSVANRATQELLELAGHVPTKHLEIHRPDYVAEEYKDKSEDEIRKGILQAILTDEDQPQEQKEQPILH